MSMTPYPNGITSFGMPVIGGGGIMTTGEVYFVHHTGSNGNVGTDADHPFQTLSYAYDQCTAGAFDLIFLMPNHAETITSTVALDTDGVGIIGLGHGSNRPKITQDTTSSDNMFEVTGDGQFFSNVHFYDGCGSNEGEVMFDIQTGADALAFYGCKIEQRGTVVEAITVANEVSDLLFKDCDFIGTSAGPDNAIVGEDNMPRFRIEGCRFNYVASAGIDKGCILLEASGNWGGRIADCYFAGIAHADGQGPLVVVSSAGVSNDGIVVENCRGHVSSLDYVFDAGVSAEISVINCYFTQYGSSAYPRGQAGANWYAPSATVIY